MSVVIMLGHRNINPEETVLLRRRARTAPTRAYAYEATRAWKDLLDKENRKLKQRLDQLEKERFNRLQYYKSQRHKLTNELHFVILPRSLSLDRICVPKYRLQETDYRRTLPKKDLIVATETMELQRNEVMYGPLSSVKLRAYNFIRTSNLAPGQIADIYDDKPT